MRAGFEGGQMPIYMRLGKMRGNTSKDAMPIGPFRTVSQGVNVRDLERVFDAGTEVTPELLKAKRLIRSVKVDVKILGQGDLSTKLTVSAHNFSKSAREKIEAAGGQIVWLRGEPKPKVKKVRKKATPAAEEPENEVEVAEQETAEEEPEVEAAEAADES
jgi:large subunit ribosomal protein L15